MCYDPTMAVLDYRYKENQLRIIHEKILSNRGSITLSYWFSIMHLSTCQMKSPPPSLRGIRHESCQILSNPYALWPYFCQNGSKPVKSPKVWGNTEMFIKTFTEMRHQKTLQKADQRRMWLSSIAPRFRQGYPSEFPIFFDVPIRGDKFFVH